jgi:hypothetical protein
MAALAAHSGGFDMAVGSTELFLLVFLAGGALWLYALVDVLRADDAAFAAAGQNKIVWVLLIVFLGFIGAILYLAIARPKLAGGGYAR